MKVISGFEYAFDDMGRLSYEKNIAKQIKVCYTYDVLSRVIQRKTVKLSDNSEVIETYSYNSAGSLCTACGNESFRYDSQNRLTEFNGKPVTYDADGNMLEASIGKFTYDSANRLVTAGTRYYVYDVEGTRIKTQKGEDTTKFIYNVNARLSQLLVKTENNADTKYVYGLGLIGEEVSGNFKTYHFDYRGSTVAITNANGTVTDTFEYDTYGKLKSRTGTTKTPFLYNGRDGVMYEDDTGLIYMRARYYSPVLRRFVNADKVHGDISNSLTLNRYSFCNGDPANGVDPTGFSKERGNAYALPIGNGRLGSFGMGVDFGHFWDFINNSKKSSAGFGIKYSPFGKYSNIDFALYDSDRHSRRGVFSETILSGKVELPNIDFANNELTVFDGEIDIMTGCWHIGEHVDLALLDIGHAEAKAKVSDTGFEVGAFASIWSPGINIKIGKLEVSLNFEVGSVGFVADFSKGKSANVKIGGGVGFSINVEID